MKNCSLKTLALPLIAAFAFAACTPPAQDQSVTPAEAAPEPEVIQAITEDDAPQYATEELEDVPVIPPEILAGLEQAKRDAPLKPYLNCTEENEDASSPKEKYKCIFLIEHSAPKGTSSILIDQDTYITHSERREHIPFTLHPLNPERLQRFKTLGASEPPSSVWAPPETVIPLYDSFRPFEVYIQPVMTKYGTVHTLKEIHNSVDFRTKIHYVFVIRGGEIFELYRDTPYHAYAKYEFTEDGFTKMETRFGDTESRTSTYKWVQTDGVLSVVETEGGSR